MNGALPGNALEGRVTKKGYNRICSWVHLYALICSCNLLKSKTGRRMTTAFHAVDRGSNPLGDANKKSRHLYYSRCFFSCLCRGTRIRRCGNLSRRGVPAKAATPLFASTHYIFCLYIRQPASTENSIHENGLSAISGIHIPAYSPLPGICSARIYSSIPHNFRTSFCGRLVSRVTSL